jgi:AcrR family transcriptional regulator
VAKIPVTHHMTLPASTAALAMFPSAEAVSVSAVPLVIAGVFGIIGALVGEVIQRIFYAHADTHLDPPAAAITIATFLIAVLTIVGVFPRSVWVPLPV